MSEKRFVQVGDTSIKDTLTGEKYYAPCEDGLLDLLNEQQDTTEKLKKENEQLRNELQFFDKIINFFADNPMTKYSSKAELLEEMKIFEKNGWL